MNQITTSSVYLFRTRIYAQNIFIFGTNRLTPRDGYIGVPTDYIEPIEIYVAENYTIFPYATTDYRVQQLDIALSNGWITQQEYDETASHII